MDKPNKFTAIIIAIICVIIIGQLFFWPIIGGFILMPNANAVLTLLLISIILKMYNRVNWQIVVFILLLLFAFNILTVSLDFEESDLLETHLSVNIGGLVIEPFAFFVLIVYLTVNKGTIKNFVKKILFESAEVIERKSNEKIIFYYNMFSKFSQIEMENALKVFYEYPYEAQVALKKVQEEGLK